MRCCPVCDSPSASLLFHQEFDHLSTGSLMDGYDVVCCDACGMAFADGLPTADAFARYYAEMSKYEQVAGPATVSPQDFERLGELVGLIQQHVPDRSRGIIDIGSGSGHLLQMLKQAGYTNLCGLDPSARSVEYLTGALQIRGIQGTLESLADAPPEWAVVILSQVLEHLPAPRLSLETARGLLLDDGFACVAVPDAAGFADCLDAPYQQFSLEHIGYFTQKSLTNLLSVAGFDPIAMRSHTVQVSALSRTPAISGLFRKAPAQGQAQPDPDGRLALETYIALSRDLEAGIARKLGDLAEAQTPLVVWGVGTHTLHLLKTTRLADCCVHAYVDSNPRYQGKDLRGVPILAPGALRDRGEPVLISSCVFQEEIASQVRDTLGCPNDLIRLYPAPSPQH